MLDHASVRSRIGERLNAAIQELAPGAAPVELVRPINSAHGDYAAPVGPRLASALRRSPLQIAADVVAKLSELSEAAPEAVGGYVNFRLRPGHLQSLVREVAGQARGYGSSTLGDGQLVQVEFVSINPTGPLHIGHGRGAILGDTLARLLAFTGHRVHREYYVNDYGTQARKFALSVYARIRGEEPPEGGYMGAYVFDLAESAKQAIPGIESMADQGEALQLVRGDSAERIMAQIKATLDRLGVSFDSFFSEKTLWDSRLAAQTLEKLGAGGYLRDRDGARWFAPALDAGDDAEEAEDRVVIRSDGLHTYFASDLAYAVERLEQRKFDRVIEIWGADHHGYVARFKAGLAALGLDSERIVIILHQMVNLKEGKVSKRAGRFVSLDELIDKVGVDGVRYFYLLRSPDAMMDFDMELAVSQKSENPVYYAQYAHARMANVEQFAAERDLPARAKVELLTEPWELDLVRQIAYWPEVVEDAARLLEPHRIPYYVRDLADSIHVFYQAGNRDWAARVVVEDDEMTRARLELCRAARNTLRSALDLMAVSAPDRM
ncbi:MAG TPA: arginine--tRNA ligase [Candidatus Dormibacteraeota bacterium]|nr:arginine--tRNA ligase [Candidatus Dormibacteraeota bacterium]